MRYFSFLVISQKTGAVKRAKELPGNKENDGENEKDTMDFTWL